MLAMLYHKYESMQTYLSTLMQSNNIDVKREELLRRSTIPWFSNLAKTDTRNTHLAQSGLMGMELRFKWKDLQRPMGYQHRKKKPKPKVAKTAASGKYSKKVKKTPESMLPVRGLSAAFKLLRNIEKEDTQSDE